MMADKDHLPACSGIYFLIEAREVIYIGQSKDIQARWRWRMHRVFKRIERTDNLKIAWVEMPVSELYQVEYGLIMRFQPRLNRMNTDNWMNGPNGPQARSNKRWLGYKPTRKGSAK